MSTEQVPGPRPRARPLKASGALSLPEQRAQRARRNALRIALILLAAVALGWGGLNLYRLGRQKLWERRTQTALARGDYQNAAFWASRLVRSAPREPLGWRVLAEAADASGSPEALTLRARVAHLDPQTLDNYYAWAKTALRLGQLEAAGEALNATPAAGRNTPAYHSLAAAWAIASGQLARGEGHFAEAARLDPTNPLHALNVAALRLEQAPDPAAAAAARDQVERLAAERTELRLPARRALLADANRRDDRPRALALAREMLADERAEFNDRLSVLTTLHAAVDPSYPAALAQRQEEALAQPGNVPALLLWLGNHRQAEVGIAWARDLETRQVPAIRTAPAQIAVADLMLARKEWVTLRDYLAPLEWKRLDYIRRAMLARVVRETDPPGFAGVWQEITRKLEKQPETELLLARLVAHWHWHKEAEDLMWHVAGRPSPRQRAALQELFNRYQADGQTASLLRVVRKQFDLNREELITQNNFAYLCLLLGEETPRAHELAASLRARHPDHPGAVSTFGLSAYLRKDFLAGLKAFEGLPPQGRREPTVALTEGLLFAGSGQREKARLALDQAATGQLLPEEKSLLEQGKRQL